MTDTTDGKTYPTVEDVEAALGALVMAFSEIELRVRHLIWALLGDEDAGQILTSAMPFKLAVAAAEQLWHAKASEHLKEVMRDPEMMDEVRKRDPTASDALEYVFRAVRAAEDERNRLLHSWWPDPSEPYWYPTPPFRFEDATIRWKADRKTRRLERHTVSLSGIRQTAERFIRTANELAFMAGLAIEQHYAGKQDQVQEDEPK